MAKVTFKQLLLLEHNFKIIESEFFYVSFNDLQNKYVINIIKKINKSFVVLGRQRLPKQTLQQSFIALKNLCKEGFLETRNSTSEYSQFLNSLFADLFFILKRRIEK